MRYAERTMKAAGLAATIAGAGVLLWLAYLAYPRHEEVNVAPSPATSLGAPAPSDFGQNKAAAEAYTRRQMCLATCASDDRTCMTLAFEPPAVDACKKTNAQCVSACPSDAR
jgi:hypothetical protein